MAILDMPGLVTIDLDMTAALEGWMEVPVYNISLLWVESEAYAITVGSEEWRGG